MTRGALDALWDGVGRVKRAPGLVFGVWLTMLAVSLPATLLMRADIADHLGGSLAAEAAADGVNYDWMVEFNLHGGAAGPLTPTVIGFAAVLDNLSAFLDREPRALIVTLTAAASLVAWLLLAGGLLDRLARNRSTGVHGFFSATGVFFFRFLRLAVLASIVYGLLVGPFHAWLFGEIYDAMTRAVTVERTAFLQRTGLYVIFAAALAGVNLLFDYAKVRAVVEDRRSMIWALTSAARFLRRNAPSAVPLYLLNLALAGGVVGAYAIVAPGAGSGVLSTWSAFAIGQVYVLGRVWAKLVCWASEIALFQSRLAHAGHVARGVPRWPDSPGVEALNQTSANL
jgi:hypothetical protein